MIPLRDDAPRFTRPWITLFLIALNVMIFLFQDSLNLRDQHLFVRQFGFVPVRIGAWLDGNMPMDVAFLPALTSMFLHGGWLHLIGNMWFLWIFGDNVEDRCGHGRFLVFYLLCGCAAAAGQILMNSASLLPTIGASGAIAGVMGAYFVLFPHSRVLTLVPIFFFDVIEVPAIFLLGFWFLMQLFSAGAVAASANTGSGGVAFAAHIAGFLVGAGGVFLFRKREPAREWES
jgi:membrane associated rhomboid family serine protease